jgi:hypothetical protein
VAAESPRGPSRWRRTDVEKTSVRQQIITAGREKQLRSFVLSR